MNTIIRSGRRWCAAAAAIAMTITCCSMGVANAKTMIKLGHLQAPANHQQAAALRMAELIASKTSGTYELKVFPAAQLGSGRDMLEAIRQGNLEMAVFGTDLLEPV